MPASHASGAGYTVPSARRGGSPPAKPAGSKTTQVATRRSYLDVLRGLAVLVMMEAHVIDSWTREPDRHQRSYAESMVLGGFAAPLFLFVAGIGIAMSAGSKARKLGDDRAAARLVRNRGLQIFALAFLFRLQSLVLSNGEAWTLLKVDILNVMGLAIAGCALLWPLATGARTRAILFAALTALLVFVSPAVRAMAWLARLPDSIEGYIRPIPGLTNFALFPWTAFVTAGVVVGIVLDAARTRESDRRANVWLGAAGLTVTLLAWKSSFVAPLDSRSAFWTTSASFFFIRLGVMIAALTAAYVWEQRPTTRKRWSPLQAFGRSSLFVYWIHVEMVYGLVSLPLHHALTLTGAWMALAAFSLFILGCVAVKDTLVKWWRGSPLTREKAFA
jgi:uncharacterized membrane protein